jgi:hypothetical protein
MLLAKLQPLNNMPKIRSLQITARDPRLTRKSLLHTITQHGTAPPRKPLLVQKIVAITDVNARLQRAARSLVNENVLESRFVRPARV